MTEENKNQKTGKPKLKLKIKKGNEALPSDISEVIEGQPGLSPAKPADRPAAKQPTPGPAKPAAPREQARPEPERPQGQDRPQQGGQGQGSYQGGQGQRSYQGGQGQGSYQGGQGQRSYQGGQGQGGQGQRSYQGGQGQGGQGQRSYQGGQGGQGQRSYQGGQGGQGQRSYQGGQGGQGGQGQRSYQGGQGGQGQRSYQGGQGGQGQRSYQGGQGGQGQRPQQGGQGFRPRPPLGGATPFDDLVRKSEAKPEGVPGAATGKDRGKIIHKKSDELNQSKKPGPRKDGERDVLRRFERSVKKRRKAPSGTTVPTSIDILESIQVGELAKKLNLKPGDVIGRLMKMGEMVTINKVIDAETAALVATEFGCEVRVVSLYDETIIKEEEDLAEAMVRRPPVVTIMGHVDHGKTRLLDTIRSTNVIDTEAGAITQHIGAYQVETPQGRITFLDTPGHEAFTAMRARGASVTDIVILVVAADDGVKEQTVEAITHAKEANVPIIVAVNKIDLPNANPDKVKQALVAHGLQPEDWGGTTVFCEISAKNNIGIEHLLEMVLLQAELLDLKANPTVKAVGRVVEARVDPGKGPVATVLVQKGTLREGDPFVVGVYSGRVRAMFDDFNHRLKEAGPATPVEITGLDGVPGSGDPFHVLETEKEAREFASVRQHYKQITEASQRAQPSLRTLDNWMASHKEIKVIVKGDVHGSVEAIRDGLLKLSDDEVKVRVIYAATGGITESDVTLAAASEALILGFQVRASVSATDLAEKNGVDIRYYSIIYALLEDVKKAMTGMLEPTYEEERTGDIEIRQVFKISKIGNVAGCMVKRGKVHRSNKIRLVRNGVVIHEGELSALKRFKDDVAEVAEGYECGLSIKGFNDIQEGDIVEAYKIVEVSRQS
ncbi:MAG: translation initiation factor IF-2 [Spirochaetae bacterium HGW-Spirochaetae-10]|nr:MAG: translation initiation factor IF-2 [Spirochaetae bacterium HGW-Spirochaetae-10]